MFWRARWLDAAERLTAAEIALVVTKNDD